MDRATELAKLRGLIDAPFNWVPNEPARQCTRCREWWFLDNYYKGSTGWCKRCQHVYRRFPEERKCLTESA